MTKSTFLALICALCATPALAQTLDFTCPDNLQADQSVARVPHGWISATLTTDIPEVDQITIFDGPPAEMASLVPDNEDAAGEPPFWTFPADKGRPVWMRCGYARGSMYMMRPLPDVVTKCTQDAVHSLSCE